VDWYRTEKPALAALPAFAEACALFLKIEDLFEAPQDIEWCVKGGKWFIVQSRPITTRDERDDRAATYLDEVLPTGIPFLWDQTEISEIAPRPNALTLSVLQKIYGPGGPVQNAYASIGITFIPRNFLRIVGDQLFIDREDELKTLLPAYSLFTKATPYEPVPISGKGAWISMVNLWKLKRWKMPKPEVLLKKLNACDARELPEDLGTSIAAFMKDYELIFLINLCAQRELARGAKTQMQGSLAKPGMTKEKLLGNSLDFDDLTPFHGHGLERPSVPLTYEWVREAARYLTVKHVDHIRRLAPKTQGSSGSDLTFRGPLTNLPAKNSSKSNLGISPGTALGVLRSKEELVGGEEAILYTELLTPDLAPLLPRLKGIISQKGGSLSHLAILAREHQIPAVVLGDGQKKPELGKRMKIDGSTGIVTLDNHPEL
ncbi:MAG: PEP-utilizing enzyme, partial [Candidatus Yonathbacteria bacterium]|nr:PEP-utilizing enzyme [Candidatus Yonathbacteria bacterium]